MVSPVFKACWARSHAYADGRGHASRLCGKVLIGGHCGGGIKGAIDRAVDIGADAVQLFAQPNRAWRFPDHDPAVLTAFREKREASGIGAAFIHALYLLNLASENPDFYEKSTTALRRTAETATAIGAEGVCFHTGSHLGGGLEGSLDRIATALEPALEACSGPTWLLIENTAGGGGTIGRSVDELATIVDRHGQAPAARPLPRLVPPLRARATTSPTAASSTGCWMRSTRRSGSTGCSFSTSTTRRHRSGRIATGTTACSPG